MQTDLVRSVRAAALGACAPEAARNVRFAAPETREGCLRVRVSNVEAMDVGRLARSLPHCSVFVLDGGARGTGALVDVYVPSRAGGALLVSRAARALSAGAWALCAAALVLAAWSAAAS